MKGKRDYQGWVHSDQKVLVIVRWEAGLHEQRPQAFKAS
jgi:hypothetical protein